jgi:hypothetical protein
MFDGKQTLPPLKQVSAISARAEAELGERAGDVQDEPRAVLAGSQHSDTRTTSLPSPSSSASTASSSDSVGRSRCCRAAAASSASPSPSPAAPSTADVCHYSSLTCSITSASSDACPSLLRRRRPKLNPPTTQHSTRENRRGDQSHHLRLELTNQIELASDACEHACYRALRKDGTPGNFLSARTTVCGGENDEALARSRAAAHSIPGLVAFGRGSQRVART